MRLSARVLAILALVVSACGGSTAAPVPTPLAAAPAGGAPAASAAPAAPAAPVAPAAVRGSFTLYTSVPQNIASRVEQTLKKRHPDLTMVTFRAGTGEVVAKLAAEQKAGAIQADVVWVAEPSTYEDLKKQNLLLKFAPKEADKLPADLKDADGYYYAGRLINTVVIFNTNLVKTAPKGWRELADPAFKGKVGLPSPVASGAAVAFAGALSKSADFGWDYFAKLKANGAVQVQNNSVANERVAKGELMAASTLDYMVRELKAKGSPVDMIWPVEGAVFTPSPVGIIAASKNVEQAKAFVDYLLSQDGQKDMVEVGSFIPVRDDVASPKGAPKLAEIKRFPGVDWKDVSARTEEIKSRFADLFGK